MDQASFTTITKKVCLFIDTDKNCRKRGGKKTIQKNQSRTRIGDTFAREPVRR